MIGRTLGSYRILEQIGIGGMATVYKAYDPSTDRFVAVKVLPEYYSHDPNFRARFEREAKAIAKLEHPYILPVHTYGEEGDIAYLVMRYLPTGTLKERMEAGRMPLEEASGVLTQIASALDHAHEQHILHRDVKPSNILVDGKGNAFLTDFGIAKMVESAVELTGGALLGTPAYMSPEQCKGTKNLTPASDQYALGVVVYEMLTGRTPFQAETPLAIINMHLAGEPLPSPRSVNPNLSEEVEKVLLKALAPQPTDRFPSCRDMALALERALQLIPSQAPTKVSAPPRPDTPPYNAATLRVGARRLPVWALGVVGLMLVALVAAGLAISGVLGGKGAPAQQAAAVIPTTTETLSPPAVKTSVPAAPSAAAPTATLTPIQQGKRVLHCGDDLCIFAGTHTTSLHLTDRFANFYSAASWSPDGSQIVFSACPLQAGMDRNACPQNNLFLSNLDGSQITQFAGPNSSGPAWSPDGQWIAYENYCDLKMARADRSEVRSFNVPLGSPMCPEGIAWSPDSQFLAWQGGTKSSSYEGSTQVWVIQFGSQEPHSILALKDMKLTPFKIAWSPDGKSVAAMSELGLVYQIDSACYSRPTGCDDSSRTALDAFPEHWLSSFFPQWAGELGGATPASSTSP